VTHGLTAGLIGNADTINLIEWEEPEEAGDSGYAFVRADAAAVAPEIVPRDRWRTACVACVVRKWPYVQAGMAVAMLHGGARLGHDGTWHAAV
jgi:hypothetical protein